MGEVGVWTSIGPASIGPRATGVLFSIAIEPSNPNVVYVSSPFSGVWRTEDDTASWAPVADSLPTLAVAALAVDPSVPGRVYALLAGPLLYRSDDRGANWAGLGAPQFGIPPVTDLIVHPNDPSVLYLRSWNAIVRSGDGGQNWDVSRDVSALSLVLDATRPNVLYAASARDGILQTLNGGTSGDAGWTTVMPVPPSLTGVYDAGVALTRADPQTIYARFQSRPTPDTKQTDIYRSADGGASWALQSTVPWYTAVLAADQGNPSIVYLAGVGFTRSDDAGVTWNNKPGTHMDHHALVSDPTNPATIYDCDDGGLFRSPTRGESWDFVATGLENVLFYDLAVSVQEPSVVIGGTQDNGTPMYDGSSLEWAGIWGGDGATVAIDPTNGDVMYAMYQYAESIVRSTDHGASFHNIAAGLPGDSACFNLHFQVHPKVPNVLLASCQSLWWTNDAGNQPWTPLFTPQQGNVVRSAVEPRTNTYFAATDDGRLYAGPGGADWRLVFTHPSNAVFTDLVPDPDDPSVLYAAFSAWDAGRVFRLRGMPPGQLGGTDISAGLAVGLAVRTLAIDAMTAYTVYAGTNRGVYRGHGQHAVAWSSYGAGMAAADVRALRVHPETGVMRAGTFGRGAYEVYTDHPVGSVLESVGKITFLRAHEIGTGFGREPNYLDAEVIVLLDTEPGKAFGFKLRSDAEETTARQMLALLRSAFVTDGEIRIDYVRTGPRVGEIIRVAKP